MLIKFNDLPKLRKKLLNKKIIFTSGCFDILHSGHIKYLRSLSKFGDILVVAIDSDSRVRERKGNLRPVFSELQRVLVINSLKSVDYTLITPRRFKQKDMPTLQVVKKLKPDFYVSVEKKWKKHEKEINSFGTRLKVVRKSNNMSTSRIIVKIKNTS